MKYDGWRGENLGRPKIKDNDKLTNNKKRALNFDIGSCISEEDAVNKTLSIYFQNKGY